MFIPGIKFHTKLKKFNFSQKGNMVNSTSKDLVNRGWSLANPAMMSFIVFLVIMFILFHFFTKKNRITRVIKRMDLYPKYQEISSSKYNYIKDYKLCDFYVASSYNSCVSGFQSFDYVSEDILLKVLQSGARYIELMVFNDSYSDDPEPVISSGYAQGEWKLTFNTVKFETCLKVIRDNAFRVYDGTRGSPGHNDPLFIGLNLKTNRNYITMNKMALLLRRYFADYFLDPNYNYSNKNIGQVPLKDLMGRCVLLASDGFQGSDLEEFINYSWGFADMRRVSFPDVLDKNKSDIDQDSLNLDDIDFLKAKKARGDLSEKRYKELLDSKKKSIDKSHLSQYNKKNLTLVVPNEEGDFWTNNYDPLPAWKLGCQFVAMNYQKVDQMMDKYITTKFRNKSFVLKPKYLREK